NEGCVQGNCSFRPGEHSAEYPDWLRRHKLSFAVHTTKGLEAVLNLARPLREEEERMMKYFLDTEFIEAGPNKPIPLISIGLVSETGQEQYLVSSEFDPDDASDWVKENVLSKIPDSEPRYLLEQIADAIRYFVGNSKPEFWGYYADYDWVVF